MKRQEAHMKGIENKSRRRVTFSFQSPDAKEVFVAGTFNGWDPRKDPFKRHSTGWKAVKYLAPGMYEYRLVVDGVWVDDPSCENHRPNLYGSENCVLDV
jgi:1,4-alpha-glucan branching enzyme